MSGTLVEVHYRGYLKHICKEVDAISDLIKEMQSFTRHFDNCDFEHAALEEIARHLEYADMHLEKLRNAL
jgi:hypothetical protein